VRASATIRVRLTSEKHVEIVFKALEPETRSSPSRRSRTFLEKEDNTLLLRFEARDTTALRAALNSYLRWINLVVSVMESVGTRSC